MNERFKIEYREIFQNSIGRWRNKSWNKKVYKSEIDCLVALNKLRQIEDGLKSIYGFYYEFRPIHFYK